MEYNKKTNEQSNEKNGSAESSNSDANDETQSDNNVTKEAITESVSANQQPSRPEYLDTTIKDSTIQDVNQQQLPSSSTEPIKQSSEKCIEETQSNEPTTNETTTLTATSFASNESVVANFNELNNDDEKELASSSALAKLENVCRTETKLDNKLDKSEIIKELTTASIANCDNSEILNDSMNVIDSNGSNEESNSGENLLNKLSCNVLNDNGAKHFVVKMTSEKLEQNCEYLSLVSPIVCAIDSSSQIDFTEKHLKENIGESHQQPTSSQYDSVPSVHSNISDKGGGTDDMIQHSEQQSPTNKIVLNHTVDSIKVSVDQKIESVGMVSKEPSKIQICSTSEKDETIGCDPKHSSIVENQVAYSGSVIRATKSIVSNIKESADLRDEIKQTSQFGAVRSIRSESLSRIELLDTNIKSTELKQKVTSASNSLTPPTHSSLDLTQSHTMHSRQNSLYVSNPDFSRPRQSTEDLSSLRMKPPDFTKLSQTCSTDNLKMPSPIFNNFDLPQQLHQPSVNPANFAEISKRRNYISDLQLKTAPPPTQANSFDRPVELSRNLSNLYVKPPDFSSQIGKSTHIDTVDEPTAHVIHKNTYPMTEKSSKIITSQEYRPPTDPSIIYRNYPQISQDVTMSIVPTQNSQFPSQKQNTAEQSIDEKHKKNYSHEENKRHVQSMYRGDPSSLNLHENQPYPSQPKNVHMSYHYKADQVSGMHPYQRENSRAAIIQSGKSSGLSASEEYNRKVQSNYPQQNEMHANYYEKPVSKPSGEDYPYSQQHFNNSRYPTEFNENKSNYERVGYCETMPGVHQENYKQSPSLKQNSSPNPTAMTAASNRLLRSPIINSKPIDIPSGGYMNPPQYWPSHSPRMTQSPISLSSSPLSGRVTQSPAGASPSPQHHGVHTQNVLPAQSPTYRYSSPHQPQTSSSYNTSTTAPAPMLFKEAANPTMFQKPCKSKSAKSKKVTGIPSSNSNYYYLPTPPHLNHQYSVKVEQPAHYPQYSPKTDNNLKEDSTKQSKNKMIPDYVDLTKSSRVSDVPSPNIVGPESRFDQRYMNERHESQRPETQFNKSYAPTLSRTIEKHVYSTQQKTIMDPYVYRKASEADLNCEIIKKTLNKDISIKRSDADLSCSIFDTPKSNLPMNSDYPMSNGQYYGRSTAYPANLNYQHTPPATTVRRESKGPDAYRYYSNTAQLPKRNDVEEPPRSKNSRQPNDLKKHDLSVTVSRISAAISQPAEQARHPHSATTFPIKQKPSSSRHQKISQAPNTHLSQAQPVIQQKPSSTVKSGFIPVKRESPLDLSVKTVKTKADSTGDDYAVPSSSRDYNTPLSLKVDFSPNFQRHTLAPEKSTLNHNQHLHEHPMEKSHYPVIHRPNSNMRPNESQENTIKLATDAKYQHPHQSHIQSTYSHVPMGGAATQIRQHQMPNEQHKHQSTPLKSNPIVPTVFGRKPEELKNFPLNPDMQDFKAEYESDHRAKNQTTKSILNPTDHLPNIHHKPHDVSIKFSDFKTKNVQEIVEPSKERTRYGYLADERIAYVEKYQEQMPSLIPKAPEPSHYDPYHSRKRSAEQPLTHGQYTTPKQMRRDEPHNQHSQFYNTNKMCPQSVDTKSHDRYEIPAHKLDPKINALNYQSNELKTACDLSESASMVHVNDPHQTKQHQHQTNQHQHHYPEPTYNQMENKAHSYVPMVSKTMDQRQKNFDYQKIMKDPYERLRPSCHYYPPDGKLHLYENSNTEPYQPYKQQETKQIYGESGYVLNQHYPKQQPDTKLPQQTYQQSWTQNQQTLQPDSSKQTFCPPTEIQNYREHNQNMQPTSDTPPRPNHRMTSTDIAPSRHTTVLKGADQTVISKLRTNLEMKEIEKQKMLRNQNSTETVEDDNQKSDIASLIAARIRTKGELKGFTPLPVPTEPKIYPINPICEAEEKKDIPMTIATQDIGEDGGKDKAFDLLDWGSACNDFVEQLQGVGNKKRGRRKRGKSTLIEAELETVGQEVPLENLPGVDYKCDIEEDVVNIVKTENKTIPEEQLNPPSKPDDNSSSDEDKPLFFLRQKSLSELGKLKAVEYDDELNESSTFSESTKQCDKRTNVLTKLSEKIAKNKKEKQREKRENEKRISITSSSESEDEVSSKVNKRPKKTFRKPRTRSSIGCKNTSDDETSENGSKNVKRKNDHTKRKKSKSSSDSEPLKQRKLNPKVESDDKSGSEFETKNVQMVTIKQELISDEEGSDCKMEEVKTPTKKDLEVVRVRLEETMTRSKRKQELERQKANSKILRNDKMVKNVQISDSKLCDSKKVSEKNVAKLKCKSGSKNDGKRKSDEQENDESSKNDSPNKKGLRGATVQSLSSDSEDNDMKVSLRRRTRSAKSIDQRTPEKVKNSTEKVVERKCLRNSPQKKTSKEPINKPPTEQFPPGWENEVYEFKRSLKIPASLITIKRPSWYRKSISLPDLDPHSSDASETFSEKKQLFLKPLNDLSDRRTKKKDSKQNRPANSSSTNEKPAAEVSDKLPDNRSSKSIIDLLHQKIIHPISSRNSKKSRLLHSNEPKILPQSNEIELLPTPGAENVFKQISVFETAVLNSRTRKEYRVQKNQEIIREVFGCDGRPASAPPLHANADNKVPAITFDQKYKQYLEKMNADFGNKDPHKCEITPNMVIVKQEKIDEDSLMNDDETQDTEINECEQNPMDIKDEPLDSNERDTPSVSERDDITPSTFSLIRKRGRGARSGRRKGSSGFDYIRKKKKPLTQPNDGAQQKRRSAAINYLQEKDENDINREIRGWVLNKGVGETVLHKAARLGYIDVIAFCLERLDMNPDQKDNAGYTALHEACSRGHLDIARLLLEYGANHSETGVLGGIRPLHEAIENGYIEIARLLLSYGADPLLATYSGQTPIMLAENDDPMIAFLKNYVHDIQNTGPNKMPWRFEGAWKKYDAEVYGYDIFDEIPSEESHRREKSNSSVKSELNAIPTLSDNVKLVQRSNNCDSNSNIMFMKSTNRKRPPYPISLPENHRTIKSKYKNLSPCTVVLTNLSDKNSTTKANGTSKPSQSTAKQIPDISTGQPELIEFSDDDSDAEFFEIEESQAPHVPLYHLRDEGAVKWALLSDLCYMLKVKSKDTLLKQICSSMPPSSGNNKELLRELKMGDFLERATCLQLLCAGEKINIRSSKVVLVKYNDSVKNLLGIKTLLMKM